MWLKRLGKPIAYTLIPMLLVGAVTLWAMAGNLVDYFGNFEELWLLAISGSVILALDVWIILEGLSTLMAARKVPS